MKGAFVSALGALMLATLACSTLFPPRPEVKWDTDPQAMIIQVTFCCGFVPQEVALNYIPDATVWGDGRIVWVESGPNGERRVLEGRLSASALRELLQRAVNEGFFGWRDSYGDYSVTDLASQCLRVSLAGEAKSGCEYYRGAPQAFHSLYDDIASGAGVSGADYVPVRGFVTTYPLEESDPGNGQVVQWPVEAAGFSLAEAQGGLWVEGEALAAAWEAVNANSWRGVMKDDDVLYSVTVQVPGLSQAEPPEP
ncbi:MAG: hypothetical protein ACT4QE_02430 [Anaerolineales bacterium]